MPVIALAGCRADSFLGYLKALGILRLVALQADPGARAAWNQSSLVLESRLSEEELAAFFVDRYTPTPILNPWNNGAGFDEKRDANFTTMQAVRGTTSERWAAYRQAVDFVYENYVATGKRAYYVEQSKDKHGFIRELRKTCPEAMLTWLDAAIVITPDRLVFPYILGSGGNDGRLDFAANFAARALDVCGELPNTSTRQLLADALSDTSSARMLSDVAIGQFSPRHAGGANESNGYAAASLVNPWDYVLMLEGAVCFSGGIGRRTDTAVGRPVFPFALRGVAGGYGTASEDEQKNARGELWLPVWEGAASYRSVADLLRKGRVDLPASDARSQVRSAAMASEAAAAVVTLGVQRGIGSLQRVAFMQRNGLAYAATPLGRVDVTGQYDRGVAIITQQLSAWIDRSRRTAPGATARAALRRIDDGLFAYSSVRAEDRAGARQGLLVAVADLDRALSRGNEHTPAPRLPADLLPSLDDGSVMHRCAAAIASLGGRKHVTDTRDELREAGDDAISVLREMLEHRARADSADERAGWLSATHQVGIADVSEFLTFGREQGRRFTGLLRAYSLLRLTDVIEVDDAATSSAQIPAAYAVLKLVFDDRAARDERILRLLFTGNPGAGLALALQRARALPNLDRAPRDISRVQLDDARWIAAALLLPLPPRAQYAVRRAALSSAPVGSTS